MRLTPRFALFKMYPLHEIDSHFDVNKTYAKEGYLVRLYSSDTIPFISWYLFRKFTRAQHAQINYVMIASLLRQFGQSLPGDGRVNRNCPVTLSGDGRVNHHWPVTLSGD
jgi:hypothetical protein